MGLPLHRQVYRRVGETYSPDFAALRGRTSRAGGRPGPHRDPRRLAKLQGCEHASWEESLVGEEGWRALSRTRQAKWWRSEQASHGFTSGSLQSSLAIFRLKRDNPGRRSSHADVGPEEH